MRFCAAALLALLLTFHSGRTAARCSVAIRDFGADDDAAIVRALATGCAVTGENRAYRLTRPISLPGDASLADATFQQAFPPDAVVRAIVAENVSNITLTNIRLDRGQIPGQGLAPGADPYPAHLDTAGILLSHVDKATLTDVEVFGDGVGTGIKIVESAHVRVIRPHVHDMRWASAVQPVNEIMVGIWVLASRDVTLVSPRVHDLTPAAIAAHGGRADGRRNNMTDGINSSGAQDFAIVNAEVWNVGEGVDFSGTHSTLNFTVDGALLHDIDSFCFKSTNAESGVVRNSVAERCGLGGFILAGRVSNVAFIEDEARDIGANGLWPANKHTGFSLEHAYASLPTDISISKCRSVDTQQTPTTTVGFFNEARPELHQTITFSGNQAQGFLRAATSGFDVAR